MMRVLHVLNTGKYSGAENVVITLIHAMDDQAECAYVSPDGFIKEILRENHITFYPISTEATNSKELKRIIKSYKPDVIHTHDYNAGIMAALTGTDIPIINHLHNNTPWLKTLCLKSIVYFSSCMRYKRILTVSDSVMNEFIFGKYLKKKSEVVGNPIDTNAIRAKADSADIVDISDIVFLGRLSPQKNPLFFVDIIRELAKEIPGIRVSMVGAGELRAEVEKTIKEYGLSKNIKLYGFLKNPYGVVRAAKVMCMPSAWEGFGLAAVEGLALGKPVIASPVGGLPGIITPECGGLCSSIDEYLNEIKRLLFDEAYYSRKVRAAEERAKELDNLQAYSDRIMQVYNDMVK